MFRAHMWALKVQGWDASVGPDRDRVNIFSVFWELKKGNLFQYLWMWSNTKSSQSFQTLWTCARTHCHTHTHTLTWRREELATLIHAAQEKGTVIGLSQCVYWLSWDVALCNKAETLAWRSSSPVLNHQVVDFLGLFWKDTTNRRVLALAGKKKKRNTRESGQGQTKASDKMNTFTYLNIPPPPKMKTSRATSKIKYLADHAGSNHILCEWYYLTVVLYQDARRLFWTNLHLLSGSGVIIVMNIL